MKETQTSVRFPFFSFMVVTLGLFITPCGIRSVSAQVPKVRVAYSTLGAIDLPVWMV